MGNGEDVLMPWLNEWLLRRDVGTNRARVIQEVEEQTHPVPNECALGSLVELGLHGGPSRIQTEGQRGSGFPAFPLDRVALGEFAPLLPG